MERVNQSVKNEVSNSFVEQNENLISDFQKINKNYRDSGIKDITNQHSTNFTRTFSNSEQVMFNSVDRKPDSNNQ